MLTNLYFPVQTMTLQSLEFLQQYDSKSHQALLDIIQSKENKGMKLSESLPTYIVLLHCIDY